MKKYLPITTSAYTFEQTINKYVYVDKTDYFYRLVSEPIGIFFMSRPRRFGKSLSVSILNNIFKGNKDLFKGLKIYDSDYDWKPYPVINLNISITSCETIEIFHRSLCGLIHDNATELGLTLSDESNAALLFKELIRKAQDIDKIGKVVILIDEYDKPLVDNIDAAHLETIRQVLSDFYINIKAHDQYIRFVFMTGVTKFSKVSVFSKLNNLRDITMTADYACMYGYTQAELIHYFGEQIDDLAVLNHQDPSTYREQIKLWYNGYKFEENAKTVYNPVSIGSFINESGKFSNFWFSTGSPSFLIQVLKKKEVDFFELIEDPIQELTLDSFDVSNMLPAPLLLQTGYLTIDHVEVMGNTRYYYLRFPNYEIQDAFEFHLMAMLLEKSETVMGSEIAQMQLALKKNNLTSLHKLLTSHIASIPYGNVEHIEKTYQNIIFSLFRLIGANILNEVYTNRGRIDAVITTATHIYLIEFKIDKSATEALAQIKDNDYMGQYLASGKKVVLIGINFSKELRNISEWTEDEIN